MSEQKAIGAANIDLVKGGTLAKLIIFAVALGVAPIGTYYGSMKYLWNGNAIFAAITAVVSANVVLVVYILTSLMEDREGAVTQGKSSGNRKDR